MTTATKDAPSIHVALAAAKAGIGAVGKTGRNSQQGYNFRGVDAVVNAAAPLLNEHGVIVAPMLVSIDYDTVEVGQKRTPMAHVRVVVTYRFHGPAGDSLDVTVPGESMDSGDKAAPKAMSVAYRIALLQALNLPTDDVEPDSQSYERSPRQQDAGEDWRNLPPVNRPRRDNGNGRPAEAPRGPAATTGEAIEGTVIPPRQSDARDDPVLMAWGAKIDEITDAASAMVVRDELATANLDPQRTEAVSGGIDAKLRALNGNQAPRPSRPKGPPATERGAVAVPTGKGDDGDWVQGFLKRLDAITDPDALSDFQRQIGAAVKAQTITPAKSVDLTAAIRNHRNKLQAVPA